MKKMMGFMLGLMLGLILSTTIERESIEVEALVESALTSKLEALGSVSIDAESNEMIISLNATTEEDVEAVVTATDSTKEMVEALAEGLVISTNHTKSLYGPTMDEVLKTADATTEDSEVVENDSSLNQDVSNQSKKLEVANEPTSTPNKNVVSNNAVSEIVDVEEVVMDRPSVEQMVFDQPASVETTETTTEETTVEKVILPGGGFDSLEEVKETLDKTNEETIPQGVQPLLATNPTYVHYTDALKIWIEKVETGSQRYFWVEIDNHSAVSPIKRALANGLETVPTIAGRQNAVLAINASGYYSSNGEVMGTTLANGSYSVNTWTNASPMVIGQDGESAWTANRLSVTEIIAQGGSTTVTFGPTLVSNSQPLSINASGIGSPTGRHPRTVIGRTNAGRWFFLVVDGRTAGASGMTLYEIQDLLKSKGISYAYNLDGGGSTTLYFKGEVLNKPSAGTPRRVPDIVYFN